MTYVTFDKALWKAEIDVQRGDLVDPGHWQGVETQGKPDLQTLEVLDYDFSVAMPQREMAHQVLADLRKEIQPNLPWADDHFGERVGGEPTNPGEQFKNWPWWQGQEKFTFAGGAEVYDRGTEKFQFSHTYQERFWPKEASAEHRSWGTNPIHGIRYDYGDLNDLVDLLKRHPDTRQAYLPIFFPEDTGAAHGGRVPCTLGYHFLRRNDELHMWYVIRSCDVVRHLRDDVYLATRLQMWVLQQLMGLDEETWHYVRPGDFHFKCFSLHVHQGDLHLLRRPVSERAPKTQGRDLSTHSS